MNITEWIFVLLSSVCLGLIADSIGKNRRIENLLRLIKYDESLFAEYDDYVKILNDEIEELKQKIGEEK